MREMPLAALVRDGTLDAELGALAWLLVEAHVPAVVAAAPGRGVLLRDALVALVPDGVTPRALGGADEDFAWLPEAVELGWRREHADPPTARRPRPSPAATVLVGDLDDGPGGTWGERARIAIRALAVGYGMLATTGGRRLEDVFERLGGPPVGASDDELSRLGLVLVLGDGRRVTAAHYLRPVARDEHGHVQRLPPAVVATWDPAGGRFEHFAWGIATELADRIGLRPVELEREQARRASVLAETASTPGV
jgi:hypothetical protein